MSALLKVIEIKNYHMKKEYQRLVAKVAAGVERRAD